MIPVVPVAIVLLGCGAFFRNKSRNHGVMTPDRQKIFHAALAGGMQDPDNLDQLAKEFENQGLPDQGALLRQRANLRRLPNEIKLARRKVWRKATKSTNRSGMIALADAYEREGCTSAAMRLREIIAGLPDKIPDPTPGDTPSDSMAGDAPSDATAESSNDAESETL